MESASGSTARAAFIAYDSSNGGTITQRGAMVAGKAARRITHAEMPDKLSRSRKPDGNSLELHVPTFRITPYRYHRSHPSLMADAKVDRQAVRPTKSVRDIDNWSFQDHATGFASPMS